MSDSPSTNDAQPSVLVISTDKYPPFRVDVTVLFGKKLSSRGMRVDWIMQSSAACDQDYEVQWGNGTVCVGRTDLGGSLPRRLYKHLLGMKSDWRVTQRAKEHRYDIIEVKDKILAAFPALRAASRSRSAFVYWLSFPNPEASLHLARIGEARYPLLYLIRGWVHFKLLYGYVLKRADHVVVQSEQMKRDLIGYGIPAAKMTAVPMGVDMEVLSAVVPKAATHTSPVVCYLGTLAGERRIDFLVRCFAKVLEKIPDATLLLVGDGDRPGDVEQIRAEAARLGVGQKLTITGFLPQREALELVAAATVCVSPFYPTPILNSTSPTKLVEYMALGRPVVANDHPEQRLVLSQSRAGLCVPYVEDAFADAIVTIIGDPAEAAAMGVRGRAYVREHRDYERIADLVEALYKRIATTARESSMHRS